MNARLPVVLALALVVGVAIGIALRPHLPLAPSPGNAANLPVAATTATATVVLPDDASTAQPLAFDPEAVIYDQPHRLDTALSALRPRTPGKTNLYVVAFAGDGSEDVFRNEAEYVEQLFSQRFDAAGHVVVLENNPSTVHSRPLATLTNLVWTLDEIATQMDPEQDVLLLYLTTHGSEDHELLVDLDPLPLNQITPEDLADALHTTRAIRSRVVIVNACYSGGFIDALRNDSTLVITSARTDRTSFGCGVESDITYFGNAFLVEALNRTSSFTEAFAHATRTVAEWETADEEEHSEPQIASAAPIEATLARWAAQLTPAPPVPFRPAGGSGEAAH